MLLAPTPARKAVHPRARGEHTPTASSSMSVRGSSPRTRGTPTRQPRDTNHHRFIPAHAGNTRSTKALALPLTVHPRARGEHTAGLAATVYVVRFIPAHAGNTSANSVGGKKWTVHPRARGEHERQPGYAGHGQRFIPAHAGNTWRSRLAFPVPPVHPRARGEHKICGMLGVTACGSSPRTRGTLDPPGGRHRASRFIPAHAGNTMPSAKVSESMAVHPRARGEHPSCVFLSLFSFGSSPRTRGTQPLRVGNHVGRRFIPAHAGNTLPDRAERPCRPVHPRARGEHGSPQSRNNRPRGSSPRTRGTRTHYHRAYLPATVHPRARGEHQFRSGEVKIRRGSSPRTRGTQVSRELPAQQYRFIPAHAGNTCRHTDSASTYPVHPRARGEHGA